VAAVADRRDAREVRERSEVSACADRRIAREAQERKDRSLVQAQRLGVVDRVASIGEFF
jgi:hypothetical protein